MSSECHSSWKRAESNILQAQHLTDISTTYKIANCEIFVLTPHPTQATLDQIHMVKVKMMARPTWRR
jgi:hypothetical protein